MNCSHAIQNLNHYDKVETQLTAVGHLADHLEDWSVMIALCRTACETESETLRKAILVCLEGHAVAANQLFAHWAMNSQLPVMRASALMNLSLMRCRTARGVVMQAMHSPDVMVRLAAGLNVGLYEDPEAQLAFEGFFCRHRPALTAANLRRGMAEARGWLQRRVPTRLGSKLFKFSLRLAS